MFGSGALRRAVSRVPRLSASGIWRQLVSASLILVLSLLPLVHAKPLAAKRKILFIASYHVEKGEWTAGIKAGIEGVLSRRADVSLELFNMDTRLSKSDAEKEAAALRAKQVIERVKPDVVITSDDNAAKFLILPYFKNADLPFVFCGVNWDASVYGLPYRNTTGMIEIQLIDKIVDYLSPLARGGRLAALRGDTLTNRKEQQHFERHLGRSMSTAYVENIRQWREAFVSLQRDADILILGSLRALDLEGVAMAEIEAFAREHTRIPTASYDAFMNRVALLTLSTLPREQGEWAAGKALEILDGTPPNLIPVVSNRKAKIFLNMTLSKILGIRMPMELIEISHLVDGREP
ncbi:MAG: hypothetical protein KDI68_01365 [Gammaproteobacteria bacterium]|nr:hypothetical protein [Gammaproteobacteria bacterium]